MKDLSSHFTKEGIGNKHEKMSSFINNKESMN